MAAHPFCRECDGTGWIPYGSETLDGKLEEAYRLCPNCCTPRRCMGFKADHPCRHPGTMRYGLGYYCKEHIEGIHVGGGPDHAHEAIYYLRRWLQIARDRANKFLEMQLSEALSEAEARLRRTERELYKACEDAGNLELGSPVATAIAGEAKVFYCSAKRSTAESVGCREDLQRCALILIPGLDTGFSECRE